MLTQGLFKRRRLLTDRQATLLEELREILKRLSGVLDRLGTDVAPNDLRALRDTLQHLDELFLLVIVGEFNAGKSTFVNALLGASILPEGVTPTTDRITLLRYGDEIQDNQREAFLLERTYPAEVLRQLTIVDTPGTNAVIRRHEELTRTFIPRADLVLFITSADRPFTESERVFLELIKEWGKKIVLILNKSDILDEQEELQQVMEFVRNHVYSLLGTKSEIFAVSSRAAIRARSSNNSKELWYQSGFADMEHYIVETLDEETRVRLKLLSPLGVAEHLVMVYLTAVNDRLKVLQADFATLDNVEQQLSMFHADLLNDVQYHLSEIDMILRDLEERGMTFFDETLRIERILDLRRSEYVRNAFEKQVVGDVGQQIEQRIQVLIDWTVEKNLRLWQNITDYISRQRVTQHREGIIGEVGGAFDYNRNALIDSVGQAARQVVRSYDREKESQILFEDVRSSLSSTVLTGAAALGIGAALVVLFHSVLLDVTGVLFAVVLAAGGLFILPAKRRRAKHDFKQRINEMRANIRDAVSQQFERETDQSIARIRETISPYTRFVRGKREQLTELQADLAHMKLALEHLRSEIEHE